MRAWGCFERHQEEPKALHAHPHTGTLEHAKVQAVVQLLETAKCGWPERLARPLIMSCDRT